MPPKCRFCKAPLAAGESFAEHNAQCSRPPPPMAADVGDDGGAPGPARGRGGRGGRGNEGGRGRGGYRSGDTPARGRGRGRGGAAAAPAPPPPLAPEAAAADSIFVAAGAVAVAALRHAGLFEEQARTSRYAVAPVAAMACFHLAAQLHPAAPSDVALTALASLLVQPHWLHMRTGPLTPVFQKGICYFHSSGAIAIRCPDCSTGWFDVFTRTTGETTIYSNPGQGKLFGTPEKITHDVFEFCDANVAAMTPLTGPTPFEPRVRIVARPESQHLPATGTFVAVPSGKDGQGAEKPLALFSEGAARLNLEGEGFVLLAADALRREEEAGVVRGSCSDSSR